MSKDGFETWDIKFEVTKIEETTDSLDLYSHVFFTAVAGTEPTTLQTFDHVPEEVVFVLVALMSGHHFSHFLSSSSSSWPNHKRIWCRRRYTISHTTILFKTQAAADDYDDGDQCDQFGPLLKSHGDIICYKISPNIG